MQPHSLSPFPISMLKLFLQLSAKLPFSSYMPTTFHGCLLYGTCVGLQLHMEGVTELGMRTSIGACCFSRFCGPERELLIHFLLTHVHSLMYLFFCHQLSSLRSLLKTQGQGYHNIPCPLGRNGDLDLLELPRPFTVFLCLT